MLSSSTPSPTPCIAVIAAVIVTGCSAKTLTVGSNGGADGNDSGALTAASLSGTWNGYFESYHLPSGSDIVTMDLQAPGDRLTGTVVLGGPPVTAPPSDPTVVPPYELLTHSRFTIRSVSMSGSRLKFAIDLNEYYGTWCAHQPPGCPSEAGMADDGGFDPQALCLFACHCSPTACAANLWPPDTDGGVDVDAGGGLDPDAASPPWSATHGTDPEVFFDLFVTGGSASGGVVGLGAVTVHFTKM